MKDNRIELADGVRRFKDRYVAEFGHRMMPSRKKALAHGRGTPPRMPGDPARRHPRILGRMGSPPATPPPAGPGRHHGGFSVQGTAVSRGYARYAQVGLDNRGRP